MSTAMILSVLVLNSAILLVNIWLYLDRRQKNAYTFTLTNGANIEIRGATPEQARAMAAKLDA